MDDRSKSPILNFGKVANRIQKFWPNKHLMHLDKIFRFFNFLGKSM